MPAIPLPLFLMLVIILPLLAFWAWMFRDMLSNVELPQSAKDNWMLLFVIFSVFGACIYYIDEFRRRH